jgi:homocitrate synthase NifV
MPALDRKVLLKDSTLREGLDTPGVGFTTEEKMKIAELLDRAGVQEIEIVAPGFVIEDVAFAELLREKRLKTRTSGLIYAYKPDCGKEIEKAGMSLDRFDLLMPVSERRRPKDREEKVQLLLSALAEAKGSQAEVGVGFPHSTQTDVEFLLEIAGECLRQGAQRVTVYDTNGSADPFEIYNLITRLRKELGSSLCFHGHNDLGLAAANSLAAAYAGADVLDVTINGLGDRAGNASLEQVAMALYLKGVDTGVTLQDVKLLSRTVAQASGVMVPKLAPVVGAYCFCHKSPGHLDFPGLFEAFDPALVGAGRSSTRS